MNESTVDIVATPAHDTLRRVVMWFRVLAFAWMATLVTTTLFTDDGANDAWVWAAIAAATAVTAGTIVLSRLGRLDATWWVIVDGLVAVFTIIAPGLAEAANLFYGGFGLSWLLLVVWARPTIVAGAGAVVTLIVAQVIGSEIGVRDVDLTDYAGDVLVWVISGIAYGWALYAIRDTDVKRAREEQLRRREEELRRHAEEQRRKADLATDVARKLHDTVLQELAAMRMQPERHDVASASIRLDRLIRRELNRIGAEHPDGFRVQLYDAVEEVCDRWDTWIHTAIIDGDCSRSEAIDALVSAAREALRNAFKHAGSDRISVTGHVADGEAVAEVRDFGTGFDVIAASTDIPARVEPYGGSASVVSNTNGTTWTIRVPCTPD